MSDSASAFQRLHADQAIQFDFPGAPSISTPPNWLKLLLDFLARHGEMVRLALWLLLGALALFLLYQFLIFLSGRESRHAADLPRPAMPAWQPDAAKARATLLDAERLAAEGQFDVATHHLLLVAVEEIRARRPGVIAPALTSREIGGHPALSPLARQVFGQIAILVERSRFAGRSLSADDFVLARNAFSRFTEPEPWQVAA